MDTLPLNVQNVFQTQINQLRKYDIVRKIHDKDNDITYFIHEFKDDPEVSYLDYLNNEFIPKFDYNNPYLVLRTDYNNNRDMNYANTAYSLYVHKYLMNMEIHQEISDNNPRENGTVDFEKEI